MPRGNIKLYLVIVLILLGISLGIVVSDKEHHLKQNKSIKVGMALYDGEDIFVRNTWEDIQHYVAVLNREKGLNIIIEGVDGEHDQELQNSQIDNFIRADYDILIANTVDRQVASMIIDKAQNANIPLIFFNREPVPQDMKKWDKTYYVGSKAEQAGTMQGEILIDGILSGLNVDKNQDGKLQYVMLEGEYGHQDAILRTYHCIQLLEGQGYKMDNLATDTAMWRQDMAEEKMREWLLLFDESIEVVLANNDAMAMGAIEVLREKEYFTNEKWIPVLGVDGIDEALEAIEEGVMLGTVLNDSDEQARCIVSKIYELITGEKDAYCLNTIEEDGYFWALHKKITKDNVSSIKKHNRIDKK